MKRIGVIVTAVAVVFCALHTAEAMWVDVSLDKLVADNPVVLLGKIEKIKAAKPQKGRFDIAYIKVAEVLKNELDDRKIKEGESIPLSIPAAKGIMVSTAIRYTKGKEGIWILEYKDKTFWATYPKDYQPLKEKDNILQIIRKQSAGAKKHTAEEKQVEDLTPVASNGKWGFNNSRGKIAIQPTFDDAYGFSEGLAAVSIKGKWGYIGSNGKFKIPATFDKAFPFSQQRGRVLLVGKYGYVDPHGKLVISYRFKNALEFREGLAPVEIEGEWGYIDRSGKVMIAPRFDSAALFSNGQASIMVGEKTGVIDQRGNMVKPLRVLED